MILSAQTIRAVFGPALSSKPLKSYGQIYPFCERTVSHGMSYGLSSCGYDLRLGKFQDPHRSSNIMYPGDAFLVSVEERIIIPRNIVGEVKDKSSWARRFLAVQNTVVEPGWEGYLTLELTNHGHERIRLEVGMPICQIMFQWLDCETEQPYAGKYQDQPPMPVASLKEAHADPAD